MFGINFDPAVFVGFMLGFVLGTAFHEFMHAFSALLLGDTTAQSEGRVTLNPAAHFDPLGFFMGILLALGVPALAWGRPVPVNPYALRMGRRGMSIVSIAGPLSNLVFAGVLAIAYRLGSGLWPIEVEKVLGYMIIVNIFLFSFNLIPIPPLDGFNMWMGLLPNYWTIVLEPIRRYAIPILLGAVLFVPYIGMMFRVDLNPLWEALRPVVSGLQRILLG